MNGGFLRLAWPTGLLIGLVNILFTGLNQGFGRLPVWFYLIQLLLVPAMWIPLQAFPGAAQTPQYLRRAAQYIQGWAVPYAIYKFSSDAVSPDFQPWASVVSYLLMLLLFGLLFAALRKPGKAR